MKNDQLTRGKLLRVGGLLLALMTIIAGVGYVGMNKIDAAATEIAQAEDAVTQALLADMAHDATRGAVESAFRAAGTEDPADDEVVRADVADASSTLIAELEKAADFGLSPDETRVLDTALAEAAEYADTAVRASEAVLTGAENEPEVFAEFQADFDKLVISLDSLRTDFSQRSIENRATAKDTNSSSKMQLYVVFGAALLTFLWVGRRFLKMITSFIELKVEADRANAMVKNSPTGMVFADEDEIVQYINPAFADLAHTLGDALPVKADDVVGSKLPALHPDPAQLERIIQNDLPHQARLQLGKEWVDLMVDEVNDEAGNRIGTMTNWVLVTDQVNMENQQRETSERIAGILAQVNTTATQLASAAEEFTSVSRTMSSSAEGSAAQAGTVSNAGNRLSENTANVALGVSELRESIGEISRSASEASAVANEALAAATHTGDIVSRLGVSSAEISSVVGVISSIAEQTNLLALNATIEAARAGELGKGFAVVANEVKELANSTAKATGDIQQKVEAIQSQTREAVAAIEGIAHVISQITDGQVRIAAAVEEQSATSVDIGRSVDEAARGSAEIAEAIQGVARGANDVASGANDTEKAAEELARLAASLKSLVSTEPTAIVADERIQRSAAQWSHLDVDAIPAPAKQPVGASAW
ncbi:MAG: methyl-accepting chemotaxis protein [Actinobacteria bacterium]|nr:methyl-accepting chemotaxis protein [Actinomycetota bacterium]